MAHDRTSRAAQDEQQSSTRNVPVLQPGYTFGSVTDKISSIVLTRHTPPRLVDRPGGLVHRS